jgi:SAM-dependent methyltransferase
MGKFFDLMQAIPRGPRPIAERVVASPEDREYHWDLGREYFDGTRAQGYGGYKYDGRWIPVAHAIFDTYKLPKTARILDIGCAKGFLLSDIHTHYPESNPMGLDISSYALEQAQENIRDRLILGNAASLPFEDKHFDFVFSNNSLHNIMDIDTTIASLREIQRVAKAAWISIGAYETAEEKERLDTWAVVATTYLHTKDWLEMFRIAGYGHDYFWFKP